MLPKLLFTKLPWTVNDYVNCARDLYHLLAVRATSRLPSCWYQGIKAKYTRAICSGRAEGEQRVCVASVPLPASRARHGSARPACFASTAVTHSPSWSNAILKSAQAERHPRPRC